MKFRKPLKITSRTSTLTNSFVQAIIPSIEPSSAKKEEALRILGMTFEKMTCVYCGQRTTDLDHLRPLVRNKRPTGYINEIRNLVPACGPCNQSKSGRDWREWMESSAVGSPKTRGVTDLAQRIERLLKFEEWGAVKPLRLEDFVGEKSWAKHWENLEAILGLMSSAQKHAEKVNESIRLNLHDTAISGNPTAAGT